MRAGVLKHWSVYFFAFSSFFTTGQVWQKKYYNLINRADSFYQKGEYKNSAQAFSKAFLVNKEVALFKHRYKAACAWALAGNPDSAFAQLDYSNTKTQLTTYKIAYEPAFDVLHKDNRWKILLDKIGQQAQQVVIRNPWEFILTEDQKYRKLMDVVVAKYGYKSAQAHALLIKMHRSDSMNLKVVTAILDKYGWIGQDIIGEKGNAALFLVIQHADLKTQEKYLPMIKSAVLLGNAQASNLALLEDRIALRKGKKQIYGSQLIFDEKKARYVLQPIDDESNVNERRREVGLQPLEEYVKNWGIDYKPPGSSFYNNRIIYLPIIGMVIALFLFLIRKWRNFFK